MILFLLLVVTFICFLMYIRMADKIVQTFNTAEILFNDEKAEYYITTSTIIDIIFIRHIPFNTAYRGYGNNLDAFGIVYYDTYDEAVIGIEKMFEQRNEVDSEESKKHNKRKNNKKIKKKLFRR